MRLLSKLKESLLIADEVHGSSAISKTETNLGG